MAGRGALPQLSLGVTSMNLPQIDISTLPDLNTLTGVFGSTIEPAKALIFDDSVIIAMVFLYEIMRP